MLQSMHDKVQGLIAGIIAVVISVTFVLWGVQNYLRTNNNLIIAEVNGKKITQHDFHFACEQRKREKDPSKLNDISSIGQNNQSKFKNSVFEGLIEQEVVSQKINKLGLKVGSNQLWGFIKESPYFQTDGKFSFDLFQHITKKMFFSAQNYINTLKYSMLQHQFIIGLVGSEFILPNELAKISMILKQKRDFGYFIVTPNKFSNLVQITDNDMRNYYEQHKDDFIIPEKISIQYLKLSAKDLSPINEASKEQLEKFYHEHVTSFSLPKKWHIMKITLTIPKNATLKEIGEIRKKLKDNAFSKKKTTDKLLATAKKEVIWVTKKEVIPEIAYQLDSLEVGQISKAIIDKAKDSCSIVKVVDILPEKIRSYTEVASKVKQMYSQKQIGQVFSEESDKLSDLTYMNSDNLAIAAKELGLKIQETPLFAKNSAKDGILANPRVVAAAFSDVVLKQGYNSHLIEIEPGVVVVLRLGTHMPESIQPFDQAKKTIEEILKNQALDKKADDLSKDLLLELQKGKDPMELSKKYGIEFKKVIGSTLDQDISSDYLVNTAFKLTKSDLPKVATTVVKNLENYFVLQLLKTYEEKDNNTSHEEKNITNNMGILLEKLSKFNYQLIIDSLKKKAKIKIFDKNLKLDNI